MGMFDKPQYLTGGNGAGFVEVGETFWLHNCKIEGTSTINGEQRTQAKMLVSHERDGEKVIVFTSGKAITGQVSRFDQSDKDKLPMEVRIDALPSGRGNPTNVMTPADQPVAGSSDAMGGPDGF